MFKLMFDTAASSPRFDSINLQTRSKNLIDRYMKKCSLAATVAYLIASPLVSISNLNKFFQK